MRTPEERLATLEQFRTETMKAYEDMAFRVTMLQGLTEDAVKRLAAFRNEMNEFREEANVKLDNLNARFDFISGQLAVIQQKLDERK